MERRLNEGNPSRGGADNAESDGYQARLAQHIKLQCLVDNNASATLVGDSQNKNINAAEESGFDASATLVGDSQNKNINAAEESEFDDLYDIFPIKIKYCDLSSLEINPLPSRCSFPILIRDEYQHFSKLLSEAATSLQGRESGSSRIVSGQPGIGKTTYLYYCLINRLLNGERTYFQTEKGEVFLLADSITSIKPNGDVSSESVHVVALVDCDKQISEPAEVLSSSSKSIQIIATSSPKTDKDHKWLTQLPNGTVGTIYAMDLWRREEFLIAGLFFYPLDIPYCRIKHAISHFGHNPRNCFLASMSNVSMNDLKMKVVLKISDLPRTTNFLDLIAGTRTNNAVSHMIFQLSPQDDYRLLSHSWISAVSKWAFNLLLRQYEKYKADAAREFYDLAKGTVTAKPLAGIIWERQVHLYFRSLRVPRIFPLRSLDGSNASQVDYAGNTVSAEFQLQTLGSLLEDKLIHNLSCYLVPSAINFGAIDSLYYHSSNLVLLQMTEAKTHPIKVTALQDIQRCLKRGTVLADLRPSDQKPWCFVFVVPKESAINFACQTLEGSSAQAWGKKVNQFVLGLSDDEVWLKKSFDVTL